MENMTNITTVSEMHVSTSNPVLAVIMGETAGSHIPPAQNISGRAATDACRLNSPDRSI
jgi:hypothetical protein